MFQRGRIVSDSCIVLAQVVVFPAAANVCERQVRINGDGFGVIGDRRSVVILLAVEISKIGKCIGVLPVVFESNFLFGDRRVVFFFRVMSHAAYDMGIGVRIL